MTAALLICCILGCNNTIPVTDVSSHIPTNLGYCKKHHSGICPLCNNESSRGHINMFEAKVLEENIPNGRSDTYFSHNDILRMCQTCFIISYEAILAQLESNIKEKVDSYIYLAKKNCEICMTEYITTDDEEGKCQTCRQTHKTPTF